MNTHSEIDSDCPGSNSPLSETMSASWDGEDIQEITSNGLRTEGAPFNLENVNDYQLGGHHPIHLGDTLGQGRYRIIHKLGNGGFANVWLCRDIKAESPDYVALKVLMAGASTPESPELVQGKLLKSFEHETGAEGVCLFLDHFNIEGPNGSHLCLVYPVLGPAVSRGLLRPSENTNQTLREICRSTVRSMAFLHKKGVCHGDFTPNNVLQRVYGLKGLSEKEVLRVVGETQTTPLVTASGESHQSAAAPHYMVYPVDWELVDSSYVSNEPCINDLGEAFDIRNPPKGLGIPMPWRAPELVLEKGNPDSAGIGFDIWALGCTLFEIRTGRRLFDAFDDDDDEYLDTIVSILGPMPEPWWSTTWEARKRAWTDETDEVGRAIPVHASSLTEPAEDSFAGKITIHPSVAYGARSLEDKLAPGVWYIDRDEIGDDEHREIQEHERNLFADLLRSLLRWRPEERISAEKALDHEWFKM